MTPERRKHIRHAWDGIITFVRNWVAIALGTFIVLVASHGRLVHDLPLTMHDDYWATLGIFAVFGWKGLEAWKELKQSPNAATAPTP